MINEAGWDRVARVVIGVAMLVVGFGLMSGTAGLVVGIIGFVPLLHLSGEYTFAPRWLLEFDFDGLAGGPGRAFDSALKVTYELGNRLRFGAGYRTLEGGADVDSVYNFAWLHYGILSVALRL